MRWRPEVAPSQALLLLAAVICLITAGMLVAAAGLPDRAAFTGVIQPDGALVAPEIGAVAPPFQAATVEGTSLNLADLRGAPVIINFWATWCEPCRVELPALQAVYAQHQREGLRVLAVNLSEPPDAVRAWKRELGLTFDLLLDPDSQLAVLYHLRGQPSTYVLSPSGLVTHIFYGPTGAAALETALAPLFPDSLP